ncbi:MAG: pseudouridine synthase [Lachnospiraceae bacterium]|nr:pseudouridine synthase [Lachnospiraceae bacterium]MBQ6995762.1 pseudouridine synthase [Lachnospiraceae bacterium]
MMRINKYLAECGVCSRREADKYIEQGKVKVNQKIAVSGMQVSEQDVVEVFGKVIEPKNRKIVLAYYKPIGVTCTEKDAHADKTIIQALNYPVRLTYAGRLDKDSEGLIIMTNDGDLIQNMMKGANGHEKEYMVKVNKEITKEFLEKMSQGVYLKELDQKTRPCKLEQIGKFTFRIILTQGLNRQIRRMCQEFGYKVTSLRRDRVVNVELKGLRSGQFRELQGEELAQLYELCGMK